jgi:DNA gyrase subunit A
LNLKEILEEYVKYRKKIITKRTEFDLKKAKERQEIVSGLLIALKNIDEIIKLIKKADNATDALKKLSSKFDLSRRQSQAVLDTKLQQLTSLEQNKLKEELEKLEKDITSYEKILGDIKEVEKIIIREAGELKKDYGDERRTKVLGKVKSISEKDLVQKKEVIVTVTEKGYCKRMDISTYHEQRRGGKGIIGSGLATEDFVKQIMTCDTHEYLMFFTTRGRVLWLKAYEIPETKRYMKGKSLANILNLKDEEVTNVISVKNFEGSLFMATKLGKVKKISLKYFSKPRKSGLKVIKLPEDNSDKLIDVQLLEKNEEIFLATRGGRAIKFDNKEVREMSRSSYGVTGIKLDNGDEVVSLEVLKKKAILTISENGYGKRTDVKDYRKTSRAGKGIINMKLSPRTGKVVTTVSVDDNDGIIITTAKGLVMRTSLKNIRIMGRATQGVRIVKLSDKDHVTDLIRIGAEEKSEQLVE